MIYHIYFGTSGNSGLYLDEIYQVLKREGYNQKVFVSYYYPFSYGEKIFFRRSDIEHSRYKGRYRKIVQGIELISALVRIVFSTIKDKPDVINFSLGSGSYYVLVLFLQLIKKISGCKLIITCHDVCPFGHNVDANDSEIKNRKKIFTIANFLLVHNKNSVIDLRQYFGVDERKIVIHLFPIMNLSKLYTPSSKVKEKSIDFLFIGGLRKEKGINFLLNTWKQFSVSHPQASLCVAGIKGTCDDFDPESFSNNNVIFHLHYLSDQDYIDFVASSKYVLLPYIRGTNSGIISTVLSLGVKVITSDIPMFKNNPLLSDDDMFESESKASFMEIMDRKLKCNNESKANLLNEYKENFAKQVVAVYATVLKE